MNRAVLEKAAPWMPACFLLLAVAAGGLRQQGGWLFFGALLLAWDALRPAPLSAAGLKGPLLFFGWLLAAALFGSMFTTFQIATWTDLYIRLKDNKGKAKLERIFQKK